MNRKNYALLLALGTGLVAGAAQTAQAVLTEGVFHIIGSSNSPTSNTNFNVSVFSGNAGFSGAGNVGSSSVPVDETFNNPIVDYRFYTDGGNNSTAATYASGAGGLISDLNPLVFSSGYFGSPDNAKIWETTDPGAGFSTTPDFSQNTGLGNTTTVEGSIDISGLASGSIYFFYGAYRSRPDFDFTMSDLDGVMSDIVLDNVGDNDFANNNEFYAYSVDFVNDGGYDVISFVNTNTRVTGNGGSGRFMGLVVTAPQVSVPEPASAVLASLSGLVLLRRRRA